MSLTITTSRPESPTAPGRLRSLDGLRGLAAFVVVVHHTLLTVPNLAESYRGGSVHGMAARLFAFSPLHLIWSGGEAVILFFVLSGYVLCLPYAQGRTLSFVGYYPKRVARLYIPVFAAVAGAVALRSLFWHPVPNGSWWLNLHAVRVSASDIVRDSTLVAGAGSPTINVLWSLQWEVIFSLLLPVFLFAIRAIRTRPLLLLGTVFVSGSLGATHPSLPMALLYLPVFALGTWMAIEHRSIGRVAQSVLRGRFHAEAGLVGTAACIALLTLRWTIRGWPPFPPRVAIALEAVTWSSTLVGSALAIVLALYHERWQAILQNCVLQWLGARSFSLYLVHEPLVVALAFATKTTRNPWLFALIAISGALIAAEVFWQLVERNAIAFANRVGRYSDQRTRRFKSPQHGADVAGQVV